MLRLTSALAIVGLLLAAHAPAAGIAWLAESPALLRALPSFAWRSKMLQYGALLAEQDPEAGLAYLRRSPELINLLGEESSAVRRFENWFKAGMEVLSYSPEGGRAYFATDGSGFRRIAAADGVAERTSAYELVRFIMYPPFL